MAEGPPLRVHRPAHEKHGRNAELDALGVRHPGQEEHPVGWRPLSGSNDLQGRLPKHPSQGEVRPASFPPQCLPLGHGVLVPARRGERLEAGHYHQADLAWYPGKQSLIF